jgi:hypothetical protein
VIFLTLSAASSSFVRFGLCVCTECLPSLLPDIDVIESPPATLLLDDY